MDRRTYKAFTLIEMLIVMGILVILMVVGIAAGRYATQRAQDIAHQNAVTSIYQGLAAYFTDHGKYPEDTDGITDFEETPAALFAADVLGGYIDVGSFDGGIDTHYWYFVGDAGQSTIVCVALGGLGEEDAERGIYCDGNGFSSDDLDTYSVLVKGKNEAGSTPYAAVMAEAADAYRSEWNGTENEWVTTP